MAFLISSIYTENGKYRELFLTKEFICHEYELPYSNIKISGKNDLCLKKDVFVVVVTKVFHHF